MRRLIVLTCLSYCAFAICQSDSEALDRSVAELRNAVGHWQVVTEALNPDGSVARTMEGTYTFEWVVPDRVISGKSEIPAIRMAAGILFYIRESSNEIEMVSVARDGRLWVMTGKLGGNQRFTEPFDLPDGTKRQLRFTRSNASEDSFESHMHFSDDGGETWVPANHQVFERAAPK